MSAPASWLVDNADLLPPGGRVLDVACGNGRNALWLARMGFDVRAIDRNPESVQAMLTAGIDAAVIDLETDPVPELGTGFDTLVVFNYLHRPLFPSLRAAVKPGGRIFYETFTIQQAERGHPCNPAFLLKNGELAELVQPFAILRSREGEFDGRLVASVVAERHE